MFQIQWLRRLIRRHTTPMTTDYAGLWKKRLSIGYMIIGWNAFGFVVYNIYLGKADWATYHGLPKEPGTPAQQWSKTLGIKDVKVYRISGFNVEKYEVKNEFDASTKKVVSSTIIRGNDEERSQVTESDLQTGKSEILNN